MTRDEFLNNVTCWDDLIDFCHDENCDICDYVYSEDAKNEYFDQEMRDLADEYNWEDMLSFLQDVPDGYDYYIRDDYDDWSPAGDNDFVNYKDDVLEWGDESDAWEEDNDIEEEYFPPEDEEIDDEEYSELDEGMSVDELFIDCASVVQIMADEKECEIAQVNKAFNELLTEATAFGLATD